MRPLPTLRLPEFSTPASLRRLGLGDHDVAELSSTGRLIRIRRGHYARPDARPALVRAVRLGGRLTSYSALHELGSWLPPDDDRLHVAVGSHARALRDPDSGEPFRARSDVVVHWKGGAAGPGEASAIVPIGTAIRHLPAGLDPAHVVAVLDSVLRKHLSVSAALAQEFSAVPRLSRALRRVDVRAESGTESVARIRLLEAGLEPELQVELAPYRVDFLLARRLVVEVEGREFHDTESTFEHDRRRAAELTRRGYRVLHFSYAQVLYAWPTCLAAIRAALVDLLAARRRGFGSASGWCSVVRPELAETPSLRRRWRGREGGLRA